MDTHSSILAWRIPGMAAWWAAVYGVAQNRYSHYVHLIFLNSESIFSLFHIWALL